MPRTDFSQQQCPVARALDRLGEGWSILILRDAYYGVSRFDDFRKSLGIAPNILARRLDALVDSGLLERRPYSLHPLRHDYLLTAAGRDFRPVIWALLAWSNRHFAPEGPSVVLVERATGQVAEPVMTDGASGRPMRVEDYRPAAGPAADDRLRRRLARLEAAA